MSELFNFNFNTTPNILFGSNILLSSVSEIKNILGPRIFLISDPTLSKIGLYNSLVDHLISKGIPKERMVPVGYGEDRPRMEGLELVVP